MIVVNTKLNGVKIISYTDSFKDFRGEYVETYNKKLYFEKGITIDFVQDDYSWSTKGVLRGLHGDSKTWKLVSCPFGKYYLVVIDLNKSSATYGLWESFVVSDINKKQILIPPNHANGHLILSERAIFQYKQSEYYSPGEQFTIKYNDPKYNILWPIDKPTLSLRDQGVVPGGVAIIPEDLDTDNGGKWDEPRKPYVKYPLMRNNILREDLDAVIQHLQEDDPVLTNGPYITAFEEEWSKWLGVKYSVFVNSGSSANLLTMTILKMCHPEGGEVIVPTLTWISDISSVLQNGFTPIFVDTDPHSLSMNNKEVLSKITSNTRAVFLTHTQGFDGLTDELINELKEQNIPLIEDVCESHGATHNGQKTGSIGWISNFSFFYAHHMSTIEGGMVCTSDPEVYQQLRMLRSHGMVRESSNPEIHKTYQEANPDLNQDFIFSFPAYNVRNTEIGAIMGLSQLNRLDYIIQQRTKNLYRFLEKIDSNKYRTDFKIEGSSNYAFNLILKKPDNNFVERLMATMSESGIEYRRGSAGGGNQTRQPYIKKILPENSYLNFPETEYIHFYGFYIGNFPDLKDKDIDDICNIINSAI